MSNVFRQKDTQETNHLSHLIALAHMMDVVPDRVSHEITVFTKDRLDPLTYVDNIVGAVIGEPVQQHTCGTNGSAHCNPCEKEWENGARWSTINSIFFWGLLTFVLFGFLQNMVQNKPHTWKSTILATCVVLGMSKLWHMSCSLKGEPHQMTEPKFADRGAYSILFSGLACSILFSGIMNTKIMHNLVGGGAGDKTYQSYSGVLQSINASVNFGTLAFIIILGCMAKREPKTC